MVKAVGSYMTNCEVQVLDSGLENHAGRVYVCAKNPERRRKEKGLRCDHDQNPGERTPAWPSPPRGAFSLPLSLSGECTHPLVN